MSEVNVRANPFPGLRPFSSEEGELFYGRTECTREVAGRLKKNRFVAVTGASGSGKTSLVMAGVIPAMISENISEKRSWAFMMVRPEQNPVDHLAAQAAAFSTRAGYTQVTAHEAMDTLRNGREGLAELFRRIRRNPRQQIIIIADQFEEIFRLDPFTAEGIPDHDVKVYIDLLTTAVSDPESGLHLLVAMRSEDVAECDRFETLTTLMNRSTYLLPRIPDTRLEEVISEPFRITSVPVEHSLVKLIIGELGERHDRLPVLQHMLRRLWDHWNGSGDQMRPVSEADYEAVGRIEGAMSLHGGEALKRLDERGKQLCERLFRTITIRTDDGRELRAPARIADIAAETGYTAQEIMAVAELFRGDDYSFITPQPTVALTAETVIDLTHESIIRHWDTLRVWMDEEESSVRIYRQLAAAALSYQEGKGRLWRPPDLLLALRWREENRPTLAWARKIDPAFERTMLFLKNSEEEYNIHEEHGKRSGARRVRRFRMITLLLAVVVLITMAALAAIYSSRINADRHRLVAIQLKEEALTLNEILSDSLDLLLDEVERIAAGGGDMTEEGGRRIEVAEREAKRAAATMKEMAEGRREAEAKLEGATRKRMIAVARSLAVRSLQHAGTMNLQTLLAWQAYLFNNRYEGAENDADIFMALYEVNKRYGSRYVARITPDGAGVTAMTVRGEKGFFTADTKGRVIYWRSDDRSGGHELIWNGNEQITAIRVSPDAEWLACATVSDRIMMIPLTSNIPAYQLRGTGGAVTSLAYNGNDHLYSAATGGSVTEWDLRRGVGARVIADSSAIISLDIPQNGQMVSALTADGRLIIYRPGSEGEPVTLSSGRQVITAQHFLPGGGRLAAGDNSGRIEIWDVAAEEPVRTVTAHATPVRRIGFNRSGRQMVTADERGEIRLWNMDDLEQAPVVFSDGERDVISLEFIDKDKAFLAATTARVDKRPADVSSMSEGICDRVTRNLTQEEWKAYVGGDIPYELTCTENEYSIRVREIRGAF